MTRACLFLILAIGCTTEPAEEVAPPLARAVAPPPPVLPAPPPADPIVIDLSNDVIILQATCGQHCRYDDGDEAPDDDAARLPAGDTDAGDVVDVQDRCPDAPDDDEDVDGCPDPAPPPAA